MTPDQLTREFVTLESITGNEAVFAEKVEAVLLDVGWHVQRQKAEENRWNVYATPDANVNPKIIFCSHLDTVAPFIELNEDDNYIYGRGSCDAKGVIAAMISAAIKLALNGESEIGCLFTVGEEVDSIGAKHANDLAPDSVKYTIIGEPTDNRLVSGQKGIYLVEVHTEGKSAHSAYPELGESAVDKLLTILHNIRTTALPSDPDLGETTVNISRLQGGDRYNVIPDHASAGVMFRVSTSLEEVKSLMKNAVGDIGEIREINMCEPQKMTKVEGYENEVVAFSTDAPYMTHWGERMVIGPGSIHDAHTDNEKISKAQLSESVGVYVELVKKILEDS